MKNYAYAAAVAAAVFYFVLMRRDGEPISEAEAVLNETLDTVDTMTNPVQQDQAERNLQAFLNVIKQAESGGRYNVIYGGQMFNDYSQHPRVYVPFIDPRTGKQNRSSAAGAYQFIYSTWARLQSKLGLPDFSPASQDAAAVQYLRELGAMPAIRAGDFDAALIKAGSAWASLPVPTNTSKQATRKMSQLETWYENAGGEYA